MSQQHCWRLDLTRERHFVGPCATCGHLLVMQQRWLFVRARCSSSVAPAPQHFMNVSFLALQHGRDVQGCRLMRSLSSRVGRPKRIQFRLIAALMAQRHKSTMPSLTVCGMVFFIPGDPSDLRSMDSESGSCCLAWRQLPVQTLRPHNMDHIL